MCVNTDSNIAVFAGCTVTGLCVTDPKAMVYGQLNRNSKHKQNLVIHENIHVLIQSTLQQHGLRVLLTKIQTSIFTFSQ